MINSNCTTANRALKNLTNIQRGRIEEMAKQGIYTQVQMAKELGINQSTISQELKRSRARQMSYDHAYYDFYLADDGARVYHENRQYSQAKDHRKYSEGFLAKLPEAIVSTKGKPRIHSVDTFVHTYRKEHPNERHNGLLREFIPKGKSLRDLKYGDLQKYTNTINARPRRVLNYDSPIECFDHEYQGAHVA